MASSYAAAISALITTSTLNPPIKPSRTPVHPAVRPPVRPPVNPKIHSSIHPSCPDSPKPPPLLKNTAAPQQPSEPAGSFEEQQENPSDYGIGRQHQNLHQLVWRPQKPCGPGPISHLIWHYVVVGCRWLLQCGDWGGFRGPLPGGEEAGLGSLLHRVALLGHTVRTHLLPPAVLTQWDIVVEGQYDVSWGLTTVCMQEGALCGSEGGEECSNIHRDGAGWDQTPEMCWWTSLEPTVSDTFQCLLLLLFIYDVTNRWGKVTLKIQNVSGL